MDLFKVSPDVKKIFQSLYNYNPNDDSFYELVAKHSLRVFGMLNKLVKEVCYFKVYECMRLFYRLNENSLIFLSIILISIIFDIFSCSIKRQKKSMSVFIRIFIHWEGDITLMDPMLSKLSFLVC